MVALCSVTLEVRGSSLSFPSRSWRFYILITCAGINGQPHEVASELTTSRQIDYIRRITYHSRLDTKSRGAITGIDIAAVHLLQKSEHIPSSQDFLGRKGIFYQLVLSLTSGSIGGHLSLLEDG
nr:hypothetical protein Iba_chr10bCG12080 [Ipomoea batatas]